MSAPWAYLLEGLAHGYGGPPVVQVDRLEVAAGAALCLVGPNGAGKSTLLRLLAALERPDAGRLWLGGHRLDEREPPLEARRHVALVFQRPLLLAGSVRANVEYGLRLRGRGRREARAGGEEALELLGLGPLAGRDARALSGGETQLVALARALAPGPRVLLLDEPTAHLDPARVALVEGAVRGYRARGGATVVWATHNLPQARRVSDRAALLLGGRLVEAAPTAELLTAPRDPRAAAFVRGDLVY